MNNQRNITPAREHKTFSAIDPKEMEIDDLPDKISRVFLRKLIEI